MNPDWAAIRSHYETTGEPLRAVAERFTVSISTLFKKAAREKWKQSAAASFDEEANGSKPASASMPSGSKRKQKEAKGSKKPSASMPSGSKMEVNGSKPSDASFSNGSKVEAKGSSFHIPASINDWDRLTAAR